MHPAFPLTVLLRTAWFVEALVTSGLILDDTNTSAFTWTGGSSGSSAPWIAVSPTTPCTVCPTPMPTTAHNDTYHVGHQTSTESLTFQGSAMTLYGINIKDGANISFSLDNTSRTYFYYDGADMYTNHAVFFDAEDLAPSETHTVSWTVDVGPTGGSLALFDYAIVPADGAGGDVSNKSPRVLKFRPSDFPNMIIHRQPTQPNVSAGKVETMPSEAYRIRPFRAPPSPRIPRAAKHLSKNIAQGPMESPIGDENLRRNRVSPYASNESDMVPITPVEELLSDRLTTLEARVNEHLIPPSYRD
ncbi:hypothetical protein B0H17DRAFT_1143720 [Mycena rosella]|uniref:Uncharacterized protein n=1 Tax=Mycena rosella TaxID=1033263 RepID=A0AAD7CUK4_MYCRO|nr:hypothetical protein B0H17DRAFT_1143720 [Mycena rosella]